MGPFSADVVLVDTTSGQRVIVENFLEATDHDHLGKLITHAAGLRCNRGDSMTSPDGGTPGAPTATAVAVQDIEGRANEIGGRRGREHASTCCWPRSWRPTMSSPSGSCARP